MTAILDREYAELLAAAQPKAIKTEEENEFYLAEAAKLMQLGETLSPAQERFLKLLVNLIESFEERHYQLKAATPLEILTELVSDRVHSLLLLPLRYCFGAFRDGIIVFKKISVSVCT